MAWPTEKATRTVCTGRKDCPNCSDLFFKLKILLYLFLILSELKKTAMKTDIPQKHITDRHLS